MAKVWIFAVIMTGMIALFHMTGLVPDSAILGGFNVNDPTTLGNIKSIDFFTLLQQNWLQLVAGAGIGLVGGFFAGGTVIASVSAAVATSVLVVFLSDLIKIVTALNTQASFLGWIIFPIGLAIAIGYVIALFEWVRSTD